MSEEFDRRVIAAVRRLGPDVFPSAVSIDIDEEYGGGPSLARVMGRMKRLSGQGVLRERWVTDDKGRERTAYSIGTGKPRETRTGELGGWSPGRMAPA